MSKYEALSTFLSQIPEKVTLTWSELDSIVGGLPYSAGKYQAWWSGGHSHCNSWKRAGFKVVDLRLGKEVTFQRFSESTGENQAKSKISPRVKPQSKIDISSDIPTPDLILISCVKKKKSIAALAKDLYISDLFQKQRAYAERFEVPWFILSAEYGLVSPEDLIEPYELYLPKTSQDYQKAWGEKVVGQLKEKVGSLEGKTIEIHAGSIYLEAIRGRLESSGALVTNPRSGMKFGEILQWYASFPKEPVDQDPKKEGIDSVDIDLIINDLKNYEQSLSPGQFLQSDRSNLDVPGLYSWWVDGEGASEISKALKCDIQGGMIYAGLAGATHWPSGKKSTNTLWLRIATMHLGKNQEFSTFRRTIGAILAHNGELKNIDEDNLSHWMNQHLRVLAVPFLNADLLGKVEELVLLKLDPPLNLKGMGPNQIRQRLKELRCDVAK